MSKMEDAATLRAAFEAVEKAMERGETGDSCVMVWPATAEAFVGELQVLTQREWRRVLRVGLRLPLSEEVAQLYCFEDGEGLVARVMRLLRESQTTRRGGLQVWKVMKTPVVIRRRVDVQADVEVGRSKEERLSGNLTVGKSANTAASTNVALEEAPRKRHREEDVAGLAVEPKSTADETRPPAKTRRLSAKRRGAAVHLASQSGIRDQDAVISDENPGLPTRTERSLSSRETKKVVAGFVPVADVDSSSDLSSGDLADDSSTATQSDHDVAEQNPARPRVLTRPETELDSDSSSQNSDDEHEKVFSVLKHVAAAGLGADDSGDYFSNSNTCPPLRNTASVSTNLGESLKPLWSVLESATVRAQTVLRGYCGLSSVPGVLTAEDSLDYDLRWVEEDGHQRWTMFGEPSPARAGVRTRRQQRHNKSKWKFW